MATYNNTLTPICSYSFPSNHLLMIQLLRTIPNSEKEANSQKTQYFFMLTLAPGEKIENGFNDANRTYKYDKKVTVKYGIHEMFSLGYVMRRYALGQGAIIGNYVKFSKSKTGQKRVTIWESSKMQKSAKGEYSQRIINLGISSTDNFVFNFTAEDANSFAEIADSIAKRALDLEFDRQQGNSNNSNQVLFENKTPEFNNNSSSPFDTESENNNTTNATEVGNKFSSMVSDLPWED